jgi:general secretion pathway protein I
MEAQVATSNHCRPNNAGFTLVEVLISLAILAIALAAVMRVVTQAIDTTAILRDRSLALIVAQDQLAMHRLRRDFPRPTTTGGTRELAGREWRWQEKVSSTDSDQFRRIDIEVSDARGNVLASLIGHARAPETKQ